MKRRYFLQSLSALPLTTWSATPASTYDVAIIGGGLGGCATALAALEQGLRVLLTDETDWLGGQLTSQAVPPDEHAQIETHGAPRSYRELRNRIRDYYRQHYPLTAAARKDPFLNPGLGSVSRLCHEPRVALAVIEGLFAPHLASGRLTLLLEHTPVSAETSRDQVDNVTLRSLTGRGDTTVTANYFVDATELGDLLPLTKTEYTVGSESRATTNELHAPEKADPLRQQAFTVCFAIAHHPGEDHTIERPEDYAFWRDFVPQLRPAWPGRLLDFTYTHPRSLEPKKLGFSPDGGPYDGIVNLWTYRRLLAGSQFEPEGAFHDVSLVNWPQNDYVLGSLIDVSEEEKERHTRRAKQLNLSLLYWLQTDAPRHDGGAGYPGLRLRRDITGTPDGMAKAPYVRESRRVQAVTTILEEHCGKENRALIAGNATTAFSYPDSVGVGSYPIDLHPTTTGQNYIDFESLPFQIPLGALIPKRMENLLPACKNIGTTHITNGCYRLHPVEWSIGEAVGRLLGFCLRNHQSPRAVQASPQSLAAFQRELTMAGVELTWPNP